MRLISVVQVNDGIGEVLYLLRKGPTSTKSTKSGSLHGCFYARKKHKKHKALKNDFIKSTKRTEANKNKNSLKYK